MNYSRWTTEEELKSRLTKVNYESDIKKSGIPLTYDDKNLYIKDDNVHTLVVGSTGSGKTQTVVLPQLRLAIMADESFIVHDVKGEIYEKLSGELAKRKYNTIVINFANTDLGNSYNPLSLPYELYKEGKKDDAIELLETVGRYICRTDSKETNVDPFWENSCVSLFAGLGVYLFENAESKEEVNLNSISKLSSSFESIEKYVKDSDKSSLTYKYLSSIVLAPIETKGSILAVFNQSIKLFTTRENLLQLLSNTDFDIKSIQKEKTALFIISENKSYSRKLISLLINQCYEAVTLNKNNERRLNILIDDFENIEKINDYVNMLSLSRSYNIKFSIFVKSFLELRNTYGKEETEILKFNFGNIIYLLASDLETLEDISKLCGNKKVNNEIEPLISTDELKLLNFFEAIVLIPRMNPIRTKLLPDCEIDWKFDNKVVEIKERKKVELKTIKI